MNNIHLLHTPLILAGVRSNKERVPAVNVLDIVVGDANMVVSAQYTSTRLMVSGPTALLQVRPMLPLISWAGSREQGAGSKGSREQRARRLGELYREQRDIETLRCLSAFSKLSPSSSKRRSGGHQPSSSPSNRSTTSTTPTTPRCTSLCGPVGSGQRIKPRIST